MDVIRKEYYKALKYSNKVYIITVNWYNDNNDFN